ncbi:MAG: hypothetical protein HRU32_00665 [Rhodobacteraceae bacterium]|nr:hypothetical protein [Paracoccaceae bacterium]
MVSGEYAIEMDVAVIWSPSDPQAQRRQTSSLNKALCGAVLSKLTTSDPEMRRDTVYRLGLRALVENGQETGPMVSVAVRDGACLLRGSSHVHATPSVLGDWYPHRVVPLDDPAPPGSVMVRYLKMTPDATELSEFDHALACEILVTDPPDALQFSGENAVSSIVIQAFEGLEAFGVWAGNSTAEHFAVSGSTCTPLQKGIEG